MKTSDNHINSNTQNRYSFCSRMLTTYALIFVMAGLAEAAPPTVITSLPYTITSSGQYKLGADLAVGPGVTALGIVANDVHLNLNGHTISGPILTASDAMAPGPTTAGISVFISTNVHINNGTVKGFHHGIVLDGSISAGKGCDDNHLNDLTVTRNRQGILLFENSAHNKISGNNVSGNFEIGVFIHTSDRNKCYGNVVNNNGGITGGGGFFIVNSDGNIIANNEVSGNAPSQIGVRVFDSNGNIIQGNTVNNNSNEGIRIDGENSSSPASSGNLVEGNTALGNQFDLADYNPAPPCLNTWMNNTFVTVNGASACIQ